MGEDTEERWGVPRGKKEDTAGMAGQHDVRF